MKELKKIFYLVPLMIKNKKTSQNWEAFYIEL